jgi:hypothetical protein
MSEWKPIETAPETGTFLVYMPEGEPCIQVGVWHPNIKSIGNHFLLDMWKPTHWMPLPKPPCLTCGGHGLIGGHSGQTPESYEEWAEPCPDCYPKEPT